MTISPEDPDFLQKIIDGIEVINEKHNYTFGRASRVQVNWLIDTLIKVCHICVLQTRLIMYDERHIDDLLSEIDSLKAENTLLKETRPHV